MSSTREQVEPDSRAEANRQLYEADEHEWIARQIAALRTGNLEDLDGENIAEFLEDSMKRDRRELESRFTRLLQHLLKVKLQPEKMSRSWVLTIVHQQNEIIRILRNIPSLRQYSERLFDEAYPDAVREASAESGIPVARFPKASPWSVDEALAFAPQMPEPTAPVRKARKARARARR